MKLTPVFIAFAFMVMSSAIQAQNAGKKFFLGASASIIFSSVNGDEGSYFKSEKPLSFGIQGDVLFALHDRLRINTGLEWLAANWKYRDQTAAWPSDVVDGEFKPGHGGNYFLFDVKEQYIGVPVLFQYQLSNAEKSNLFLTAGGRFRQRISLDGDVNLYEGHQFSEDYDLDDTLFGERTKFKPTGVVGIGFELPAGRMRLSISPVYEFEFSKIRNEETSEIVGNGNGSFLGLRLGIH